MERDLIDHIDFARRLTDIVMENGFFSLSACDVIAPDLRELLTLAEKVGDVSHGDTTTLDADECDRLYRILDDAVGRVLEGRRACSQYEAIADRIMEVAFDLRSPEEWSWVLGNACETRSSVSISPEPLIPLH